MGMLCFIMVYIAMVLFAILAIPNTKGSWKRYILYAFAPIAFICALYDGYNRWFDLAKEPELIIGKCPKFETNKTSYTTSFIIEGENNNYAYHVDCNAMYYLKLKDSATIFEGYGSQPVSFDIIKRDNKKSLTFTHSLNWRKNIDTLFYVLSIQFSDNSRNKQPDIILTYIVKNDRLHLLKSGYDHDKLIYDYSALPILNIYRY